MKTVLFLCTGNSCRSIMAEALLAYYGKGKFTSYSAGSFPTGKVHPKSLETLQSQNIPTAGLRSKSWDEFKDTKINIVITVCDNAAGEVCPIFFGSPVKIHWGVPDPAHFEGTEEEINAGFLRIFKIFEERIKYLVSLPIDDLDNTPLLQKLNEITK